MKIRPLLIVKMGSTFADTLAARGDFEDWTCLALGVASTEVTVWQAEGEGPAPDPAPFSGIVMTGSHAMVTDREPWSEAAAVWLNEVLEREIPFLGICYGHQLLAHARGGRVGNHPGGREVGTVRVHRTGGCDGDPLFRGMPADFPAHATHAQTVFQLPDDAVLLALNGHDPHHAFRLGPCAWGLQFHPEFNEPVMREYIEHQAEALRSEGKDTAKLIRQVAPTPEATAVLARFARWARSDR